MLPKQNISRKYLANIDSLIVVNEQLYLEKDSVIKENKNINWRNYKLSKQNKKLEEKVSRGAVLELIDFKKLLNVSDSASVIIGHSLIKNYEIL